MSLATRVRSAPPSPTRRKRRQGQPSGLVVAGTRIGAVVVVILLWQVAAGGSHSFLPVDAVSRPSDIAVQMGRLFSSGRIYSALWATSTSALIGLGLAAPIGVALALITSFRVGNWVLGPTTTIGYAIPKVGLVSFYILMLGVGTKAHVAVVLGAVLFVFFYTIRQGIEDLDRDSIASLRLMSASRLKILRIYVLPALLPRFVTALRIALPHAIAVQLFAELRIPTHDGLGVLIGNFEAFAVPAGAMAIVVLVVAIAYTFDLLASHLLRAYTTSIGLGLQV